MNRFAWWAIVRLILCTIVILVACSVWLVLHKDW